MGIFSTNSVVAESSILSTEMADVTPALESANYTAMAIELVAESEANYNTIMKAIGIGELSFFEENGYEIVYEGAGATNFFEKVKQFFVKLWDKIKEIFHKFFAWLSSMSKNDSKFIAKYQKEAEDKWSKLDDDFTFNGFKFSIESFKPETVNKSIKEGLFSKTNSSYIDGISSDEGKEDIDEFIKKVNELDVDPVARSLAAKAVGADVGETLDSAEFNKAIFKAYRSDKDTKETFKKSELGDITTYCNILKDYSKTKNEANTAFDGFKRTFDATIKVIENAKNKISKTDSQNDEEKSSKLSGYGKVIELWKASLDITTTVNGIYLQALKDEASQAKHIITKVITASVKPKSSKNESAGVYESAKTMDFLAGVVLK